MSLKILPHVTLDINANGCLRIKSAALLTGYVILNDDELHWHDPKSDGWFVTEDVAEMEGDTLKILGRTGDLIKISGELVNVCQLEEKLAEVCLEFAVPIDAALAAMPDDRLEHVIHLFVSKENVALADNICRAFHERVLPYERIRAVHVVDKIPRTALGKVSKKFLSYR